VGDEDVEYAPNGFTGATMLLATEEGPTLNPRDANSPLLATKTSM